MEDKKKNNQLLDKLFGSSSETGTKNKSLQWFIILVLTGMGIMFISSFFSISEQTIPYENQINETESISAFMDKGSSPKTMQDYEKLYENQLTEVLTDMLGIDEVTVAINLESTEETVVEKNRNVREQLTKEQDKQGGTREIKDMNRDEQVVIYNAEDAEEPLVLKTLKPRVRGVVVVAKGAEQVKVKAMITEAVQRLLDIPPYKIAILPKK